MVVVLWHLLEQESLACYPCCCCLWWARDLLKVSIRFGAVMSQVLGSVALLSRTCSRRCRVYEESRGMLPKCTLVRKLEDVLQAIVGSWLRGVDWLSIDGEDGLYGVRMQSDKRERKLRRE